MYLSVKNMSRLLNYLRELNQIRKSFYCQVCLRIQEISVISSHFTETTMTHTDNTNKMRIKKYTYINKHLFETNNCMYSCVIDDRME